MREKSDVIEWNGLERDIKFLNIKEEKEKQRGRADKKRDSLIES